MDNVKNLPGFSQQNYNLVGYIVGALVTCSGGFLIFQLIKNSDLTFSAEWNMFKSVLIWPLYIVGLIVMFANWNKLSFSYNTYEKTTYSDGRVEVKRDWDITEVIMGRVLAPILGRFILFPLAVAAAIYYPLMCIVHLVGAIFPWILSLIIVGIIITSWMFTSWFKFRNCSIVLAIAGVVFTAAFIWGGLAISNPFSGSDMPFLGDDISTVVKPEKPTEDGFNINEWE